jgi:anion-transporting  ArsA/GET3 family ATPase
MQNKVDKANAWGSLISVWGKILIALLVFIVTVGGAWYQIETNAANDVRQDQTLENIIKNDAEERKQLIDAMKSEFKVHGERSDKRYKRAMEEAQELHKEIDKNDNLIMDLMERVSFLEGRQYERDRK